MGIWNFSEQKRPAEQHALGKAASVCHYLEKQREGNEWNGRTALFVLRIYEQTPFVLFVEAAL